MADGFTVDNGVANLPGLLGDQSSPDGVAFGPKIFAFIIKTLSVTVDDYAERNTVHAAKAIGVDIDPQAIQASRDNAQRNGVSERLELYLPKDQPEAMKADVVVANILAGPLRELAPLISVLPVEGGLLGLSGILASQAESVCEAYADLFTLDPVIEKEEWCRITGHKK